MKRILQLLFIISLFMQLCPAQKVKNAEEYRAVCDSIVPRIKHAAKDSIHFKGRPFSEFAKHLKRCNAEIQLVILGHFDRKMYPENLYAIALRFTTDENDEFIILNHMTNPYMIIWFEGSKPYDEALHLFKKFGGVFTKEVEEFYSDVIIKSIDTFIPKDIYQPHVKEEMKK